MKHAAASLKIRIEAALADKIPSALTPVARIVRETTPTGIASVDDLIGGGIPVGALTEIVGAECTGKTSFALSIAAQATHTERVCAWVDACDALSPESAAACGVDLARLLWVRCGVSQVPQHTSRSQSGFALPAGCTTPPTVMKGLHGGGHGGHPRNEIKGMPESMRALLQPVDMGPRCAEPQRRVSQAKEVFTMAVQPQAGRDFARGKPHGSLRIDQALRVTDLLLQAGGFSVLVLDFGGLSAEDVLRIPMATWFRYRAAAERTRTSVVLLTQHAVTKSSAGMVLRLEGKTWNDAGGKVLTGLRRGIEVARQRFTEPTAKVVPLRKPPQRATNAAWTSNMTWAGGQ